MSPAKTRRCFSSGSCPDCGDDMYGLGYPDGTWDDGEPLKCAGCGMPGWVSVDEDGATAEWNDYDLPDEDDDIPDDPTVTARGGREGMTT